MTIHARPRSARAFTVRLLGLILALVLAGGLASAGHAKAAKASDDLHLTFTKWLIGDGPYMAGVVGGDIEGLFAGTILTFSQPGDGHTYITAEYRVLAEDGSKKLTAIMTIDENDKTNKAVLNGDVTEGWLTGERVVGEYTVLPDGCALNKIGGPCFQGTLLVTGDDRSPS